MSKVSIRTWNGGEFFAELDKSFMSDTLWLSLPKKYFINMLGSMIYFECPLDCPIEGEEVTDLEEIGSDFITYLIYVRNKILFFLLSRYVPFRI